MLFKLNINPLLGVLLVFSLYSCELIGDLESTSVVQMKVNHYQVTGFGPFPQLVYLIQEGDEIGGEDWSYFYDPIEGFEYEPGYIYSLRVRKVKVADPPQDASGFLYILVNQRSKEKVPDTEVFDVKIKWDGTSFITNRENTMYLHDRYKIDCRSMCPDLQEQLETREEVTASFLHGPNGDLLLQSIQ
ncbi:DUF4377 domain-containing protein [Gramella sp. GC03-9]|uniref:DUF4377 domain-containing protein n=1 Tax=Christiangramia oceanisediminis TaxID=2920386 RepID=A0A9X2IA93_9FLAO|nr:DUF4377 domain-containing protein [Gramella oceanisediminis]MCP9200092.1 DUF4377 domain-containing protein [Gramella oceanisediminis]